MTEHPHPTIAAALAAFQAEMPTVPKTKTAKVVMKSGGTYSYTYADLADVTEAAMPLLSAHGLSFTTTPCVQPDGSWVLVGTLMHSDSDGTITGQLPIRGATPQEWGGSLTYMRRYLLGCLTGVVTDTDTDGGVGNQSAPKSDKPAAATRRMARPAPPPDPAPDARTPQGLDPITRPQLAALHAALNGAGITERDEALAYYAATIGRPVESSKDLTRDEASKVIDALHRLALPQPEEPLQWVEES